MIQSKEDLKYYIQEDFKRNLGAISNLKYLALKLYDSDGYRITRYLKALRKYEYAINVQRKSLFGKLIWAYRKLVWHKLGVKYNIILPPNVIGYGFKVSHIVGGGIIINCKSIGNYCSANAGVVVGNNGGQDKTAIIGNSVSLTVGSKVIGRVMIGDNVTVAPNSVVIKDVPSNCVVSGVPAKIIKQDGIKVKTL